MCLLGVIREINELDLVISLPDQLTGSASITEISKQVTTAVESAAEVMNDNDDDGQENELVMNIELVSDVFSITLKTLLSFRSPSCKKCSKLGS